MAIITGTATVVMRIDARYNPRRSGDDDVVEGRIDVGDSPRRISRVVLIGRVFKGIFVMGMIAIADTMM